MITSRSVSPFERHGKYVPAEDAALTVHLLLDGETLSGLAHRYYEDWRLWRVIADRNKILDPRQLAPGTLLLIPERPIQFGAFQSFR
jgi:nucleoid-associated protein YgaU